MGPKSNDKRVPSSETDAQGRCEEGGADWSDGSTSPGIRGPPKSGRGEDSPLEPSKQGSPARLQTSGLQNCERTQFCCLNHQVCSCLLRQPRKTSTESFPTSARNTNGLWPLGVLGSTARRHDTAPANGTRGRQPSWARAAPSWEPRQWWGPSGHFPGSR